MKYYKITLSLHPAHEWHLFFKTGLDTKDYNTQDLAGLAVDLGFLAADYLEDVVAVREASLEEYTRATA